MEFKFNEINTSVLDLFHLANSSDFQAFINLPVVGIRKTENEAEVYAPSVEQN